MADSFGLKIGLEGEKEFKKALADINQSFKVLGSEMKLAISQFDKNDKSVEALAARNKVLRKEIDEQTTKIDTLRKALQNAATSFGENDRRTQNWQIQLNNAEVALNDMNRELDENEKAIKEDGKAAEGSGSKFEGFGKDTKHSSDQRNVVIFRKCHNIVVFVKRYQAFLFIHLNVCTVSDTKGTDLTVLQLRTSGISLYENKVAVMIFRLHAVTVDRKYKVCLPYYCVCIRIQIDRLSRILELCAGVKACRKPFVAAYQLNDRQGKRLQSLLLRARLAGCPLQSGADAIGYGIFRSWIFPYQYSCLACHQCRIAHKA